VSEDGRFVFSGGEDGSVVRVGAGGDDPVALRDHEGPVLSVAASFDGTRAFSSGTDGTVRVWGFT
jgi:WD40 repeat protein